MRWVLDFNFLSLKWGKGIQMIYAIPLKFMSLKKLKPEVKGEGRKRGCWVAEPHEMGALVVCVGSSIFIMRHGL